MAKLLARRASAVIKVVMSVVVLTPSTAWLKLAWKR